MSLQVEQYGDVTRLRMTSRGSRLFGLDVSAYIVRGVMIDTGFHHARRALAAAVETFDVRGAIITHWHEDHAGNAALLVRRGLPVLARADTESTLRNQPRIQFYRRVAWGQPQALAAPLVSFDADGLRCVHTPGHSFDHQVVWDEATRTLFSGDLWLGVHVRVFHRSEDPYGVVDSLRVALALEPERMFDAHRGLVEHPTRALQFKIDWLSDTLGAIERRIAAGASDTAVLREVLGGEEVYGVLSLGDYSRRNLVTAVRRNLSSRGA
ncbi:MAG TPA: MBL fold metallo-hydrolase [Gemmatimonadaceae bacterium]|jgi:glyoxylase-like metal-dependent hydrolase (beta-lactamase superfamily II)